MVVALVPAWNEAKHIQSVIEGLQEFVDLVVVIDDASTDKTADVAQKAGAVVLQHRINRGQGAAIETGHIYARKYKADYVVHFDADGQMDPADIAPALDTLKQTSVDLVLGSRYLEDTSGIPFTKKYFLLPVARMIDRMFSGVKLTDAHCGFRILGKKAFGCIEITQDKMAHATQIIELARKHQLKFTEVPVHISYHEYGQGVSGGFRIIKELLIGKVTRL